MNTFTHAGQLPAEQHRAVQAGECGHRSLLHGGLTMPGSHLAKRSMACIAHTLALRPVPATPPLAPQVVQQIHTIRIFDQAPIADRVTFK